MGVCVCAGCAGRAWVVCGRGCGIVCCMRMSMRRRMVMVLYVAAACAIIIKFVYIFWYFRVHNFNCSCSCKEDTRCEAQGGTGGDNLSACCVASSFAKKLCVPTSLNYVARILKLMNKTTIKSEENK